MVKFKVWLIIPDIIDCPDNVERVKSYIEGEEVKISDIPCKIEVIKSEVKNV